MSYSKTPHRAAAPPQQTYYNTPQPQRSGSGNGSAAPNSAYKQSSSQSHSHHSQRQQHAHHSDSHMSDGSPAPPGGSGGGGGGHQYSNGHHSQSHHSSHHHKHSPHSDGGATAAATGSSAPTSGASASSAIPSVAAAVDSVERGLRDACDRAAEKIRGLQIALDAAMDSGDEHSASQLAGQIATLKKDIRTKQSAIAERQHTLALERQKAGATAVSLNNIRSTVLTRCVDTRQLTHQIVACWNKNLNAQLLAQVTKGVKLNVAALEQQCLALDAVDLSWCPPLSATASSTAAAAATNADDNKHSAATAASDPNANPRLQRKECIQNVQSWLRYMDDFEKHLQALSAFNNWLLQPTPPFPVLTSGGGTSTPAGSNGTHSSASLHH